MGNVRSRLMSTPESPDTPVPQPLPSSEVEGAGSGDRPAVAAVPPQSETPQPVTPSPDKVPGKQAAKSRPSRSRSSNRRSGSGSRNRAAAAVEPNERQNKRSPIRGNSEDGSRDSRAASNERQSKRSRIRGDSEDGSRDSRAASAVELEERQVKAKGSKDRSKDRHKAKRSGTRHKSQNFGHRCICSYGSCQELTRQLESVDHQFNRTLIQFNVPPSKYHDKWMPWLEALLRHLQVPEREKALYRGLEPGKKLWVAAHHFTPECVLLYFGAKTKLGVYKIRLGVKDARELLRDPLDPLDKDGKLGYMITPGYPIHEARRIIDGTRSVRHERSKSRETTAATAPKEHLRPALNKKHARVEEKKRELKKAQSELKEKDALIEHLREQNRKLGQTSKRRGERAEESSQEAKRLRQQLENSFTEEDVLRIIREEVGGLSRVNLFDAEWHKKYPNAAKLLFGFNSFDETLTMVECLFPDVDVTQLPMLTPPKKSRKVSGDAPELKMSQLTPLERCLLCRLFFRRDLTQEFIGLIFNRHRTYIGKILRDWAPRWGKAGEQLSILDITREFLLDEEPDRSKQVGVEKAVAVDGADTSCEKMRKDTKANALLYGSKNKGEGARVLTWSCQTNTFEHTKMVASRLSETALYRWHASTGKKNAPVGEWKNAVLGMEQEKIVCKLVTAYDNLFDYSDLQELVDPEEVLDSDPGPVDEGVYFTASEKSVGKMPGVPAAQKPSKLNVEREEDIPRCQDIDEWFDERIALNKLKKEKRDDVKSAPILESDTLDAINKKALESGVNSSGLEKAAQLEVHQRLHLAYEAEKLKKTSLAYFLLFTKKDRLRLLKWLGSSLAPASLPMPSERDLPVLPLGLAKIPPEFCVLGDKGFHKTTRLNPNLNLSKTPWKLSDEKVKDFRRGQDMITDDRATSDTRAVAENNYERFRNDVILKNKVPYWKIAMLPYAMEWGHANMNLQDPIRRPGKQSLVAGVANYWDKHVESMQDDDDVM